MNNLNAQKGFTLVELLIAMTIGLLITAAAAQVYVMGVRNASVQKAASGVLDANVFGLQQIEKNMRMAGLGLSKSSMLNQDCSGVMINGVANGGGKNCDGTTPTSVTDSDIYVVKLKGLRGAAGLPDNLRTLGEQGESNTSNRTTPQITIQYRAPVDMRDCEGRLALGPREVKKGYKEQDVNREDGNKVEKAEPELKVDGQVIVERYFIARNAQTKELELRCDAGRYVAEHIITEADAPTGQTEAYAEAAKGLTGLDTGVKDMGDDGSVVISGLDDFQVRLGVRDPKDVTDPKDDTIRYATIDEYRDGTVTGEVVAIKMAVLAKGSSPIGSADATAGLTYKIFDKENVTMADGQPANVIRRVYETTVMLRNSRGDN